MVTTEYLIRTSNYNSRVEDLRLKKKCFVWLMMS